MPTCRGTGARGNFPPKSLEILFLQLSAGFPQGELTVAHRDLLKLLPLRALHCEFMAELSIPRATFCSERTHFGAGIPVRLTGNQLLPPILVALGSIGK